MEAILKATWSCKTREAVLFDKIIRLFQEEKNTAESCGLQATKTGFNSGSHALLTTQLTFSYRGSTSIMEKKDCACICVGEYRWMHITHADLVPMPWEFPTVE